MTDRSEAIRGLAEAAQDYADLLIRLSRAASAAGARERQDAEERLGPKDARAAREAGDAQNAEPSNREKDSG